jgi:histidinol-phosphatase
MPDTLPYTDADLRARLALALDAAHLAGEIVLSYFRKPALGIDTKSDGSPVTIADREAEKAIRALITRTFPNDAILGEEWGETPGSAHAPGPSGFRWILDPIDGTKSFVHGVPLFGTLIGVEHSGIGVVGVCANPALAETVYAHAGGGAWYTQHNRTPEPARVSAQSNLKHAVFTTTSLDYFVIDGIGDTYPRLQAAFGASRGWSDCYGFTLLATGRVDAVIEPAVKIWDICAAQPIIEEAGGTFTDWQNRRTLASGSCIATNSRLHDQTIALVR